MAPSTPEPAPGEDSLVHEDPLYRDAVVDLLGAVAYGEISAFERLAEDARMAPSLEDKVAIASMASAEFGKVAPLHARISELGVDPFVAMAPFRAAIDLFHDHTAPADWFEGLTVQLVLRGSRFQGFTPEGERVLAWARRIVADARAMHEEVTGLRRGRLKVVFVRTMHATKLGKVPCSIG